MDPLDPLDQMALEHLVDLPVPWLLQGLLDLERLLGLLDPVRHSGLLDLVDLLDL